MRKRTQQQLQLAAANGGGGLLTSNHQGGPGTAGLPNSRVGSARPERPAAADARCLGDGCFL